ncbi:hypothetical protein B0H13DRAFT_2349145 [Mycena leptocephala]|nr:hypothetical protein B0H13DRAFT_2349145 [Mycena leptocephala]
MTSGSSLSCASPPSSMISSPHITLFVIRPSPSPTARPTAESSTHVSFSRLTCSSAYARNPSTRAGVSSLVLSVALHCHSAAFQPQTRSFVHLLLNNHDILMPPPQASPLPQIHDITRRPHPPRPSRRCEPPSTISPILAAGLAPLLLLVHGSLVYTSYILVKQSPVLVLEAVGHGPRTQRHAQLFQCFLHLPLTHFLLQPSNPFSHASARLLAPNSDGMKSFMGLGISRLILPQIALRRRQESDQIRHRDEFTRGVMALNLDTSPRSPTIGLLPLQHLRKRLECDPVPPCFLQILRHPLRKHFPVRNRSHPIMEREQPLQERVPPPGPIIFVDPAARS